MAIYIRFSFMLEPGIGINVIGIKFAELNVITDVAFLVENFDTQHSVKLSHSNLSTICCPMR